MCCNSIRLKDHLYTVPNIKDVYDLECKNNGQRKARMPWRRWVCSWWNGMHSLKTYALSWSSWGPDTIKCPKRNLSSWLRTLHSRRKFITRPHIHTCTPCLIYVQYQLHMLYSQNSQQLVEHCNSVSFPSPFGGGSACVLTFHLTLLKCWCLLVTPFSDCSEVGNR